jgi:hypothetical protein
MLLRRFETAGFGLLFRGMRPNSQFLYLVWVYLWFCDEELILCGSYDDKYHFHEDNDLEVCGI